MALQTQTLLFRCGLYATLYYFTYWHPRLLCPLLLLFLPSKGHVTVSSCYESSLLVLCRPPSANTIIILYLYVFFFLYFIFTDISLFCSYFFCPPFYVYSFFFFFSIHWSLFSLFLFSLPFRILFSFLFSYSFLPRPPFDTFWGQKVGPINLPLLPVTSWCGS